MRERRELLVEIEGLQRRRLASKAEMESDFAAQLEASEKELVSINAQLEVLKPPLDRAQMRSVKELTERKKKFEQTKKSLKLEYAKRVKSVEK